MESDRFVATLRDHFQERLQDAMSKHDPHNNRPTKTTIDIRDEWALSYIDVKWLKRIVEAFDEDSSGFVTIMEINRFTNSVPKELDWR